MESHNRVLALQDCRGENRTSTRQRTRSPIIWISSFALRGAFLAHDSCSSPYLYARVSTSDQHCEQQIRDLREYANARHWKIAAEFVETGVSGTKATRPELDRLMRGARLRQFDGVLVWKLDRWGRSVAHMVASLQELHGLGVRFLAVTQGIDTDGESPMARLMLHLLAAFAEFERSLIVERSRAGQAQARRRGVVIGRPRLIVDKAKIRQLHQEGNSMRAISSQLNISAASVCRILAHPGKSEQNS